jgi:hypothetical protein
MILTVMLVFICLMPAENTWSSAKQEKNFLILVEQTKGNWIAYDDLVHFNSEGDAVASAEILSMALGYYYEGHTSSKDYFTIEKTGKERNTYTIGSKKYTYQSGSSKVTKSSSSAAAVKRNNINYCRLETLKTLCDVSYFNGSSIKDYKKYNGIDGIYCLSTAGKISALPKVTKVKTPYYQDWYKTFVDLNVKEPGETKLYGVTFTARDHFLQKYEIANLGNDKTALKISMDEKAKEYTKAYQTANNLKPEASGEYQLAVIGAHADMAYNKSLFMSSQAITVNAERINNEDYWVIRVSMELTNKEYDLNSLKALCYFLSSTPETLYKVISYDLFQRSVVPAIPGIIVGSNHDELISEIGRQYGDFVIAVSENDEYSGLNIADYWDSFFSQIIYYVKQAD